MIGDNVSGTGHPRIMRAEEQCLSWKETKLLLDELDKSCHTYRCDEVKELLINAPTGYKSTEALGDSVWLQKQETAKLRLINS